MPTPSAPIIHQVALTADSSDTAAAIFLALVIAATLYALFR